MPASALKKDEERLRAARQYWDSAAPEFDSEADHGLRDPLVRAAWTALLKTWLPEGSARILDIGCGTGSLSVLLAGGGHTVTGIDLSPAMIALAKAKAAAQNLKVDFQVMDAADPELAPRGFNLILCRHLLWALPEPDQVLQRWVRLLEPRGRCILIEGFWETGTGLHSGDLIQLLPADCKKAVLRPLSDNSALWGKAVTDERYAIVADID